MGLFDVTNGESKMRLDHDTFSRLNKWLQERFFTDQNLREEDFDAGNRLSKIGFDTSSDDYALTLCSMRDGDWDWTPS